MREGWTYRKLGDICIVINGLWTGKKAPFITVAVIRNTNFSKDCRLKLDDVAYLDVETKQYSSRKLKPGDIIIEKSGGSEKQPVGRPVLFDIEEGDYSFSNFTATLRIKEGEIVNPTFLHRCLYGHYVKGETLRMQSKTTGLHNLDMKAFLRLPIPNLPVAEQERIVAELDLLQGIIDKQKAQLKELDTLAQSIFYDMFDNRDDCVCKIIDLCKTPDDIKCGPFGTQLSKEEYKTSGVAIWGIPQVNSLFRVPPTDFVTAEKAKALASFSVIPGDIVMSRKCAVFPSSLPEGIIHSDVLRIRLENDKMDSVFLMYQLHLSDTIKRQILSVSSGAIMPGINVGKLKQISVSVPPLSLQQSFATKIEAIERQKASINASIAETQKLFDYTMDKYFG